MRNTLTQKRVRELFNYDPETGLFTRAVSLWGGLSKKGRVAGGSDGKGYVSIMVDGKKLKAHRLAFLYMTGKMPKFVDHINRDRSDNRWANLRPCNHQQNGRNRKANYNKEILYKGVYVSGKRYMARITISPGKKLYLGSFDTTEQAYAAYVKAADEHFGAFSCHSD